MEVRALFGRFLWRGINIYDVSIHPSRASRINPALKVCEHNRAAHASVLFNLFCYGAPLKMFWRTYASYLHTYTLFTETSPVSPTQLRPCL